METSTALLDQSDHIPSLPPAPSVPPAGFPPPAPIPPRRTRRRLGAALVVIASVAGGAAAGAVAAGRHDGGAPSTAPAAVTVAAPGAATASGVASATDVSGLVARTLPSVVSIEVSSSQAKAAGSGFVIGADGEIATNAHVVDGFDDIQVTLADGTHHPAKVLGIDRTDDLAVIKIDATGLNALSLGDSTTLKVGEPVVAIGNALALTGGPTATTGIVSALGRSIDTDNGEHLTHLIQTDAAINPGNSGGPLLTLDGRVVGINSAGSTNAQNIGFAISIEQAKPIIGQLQNGQTVTKAFLGVSTQELDAALATANGLSVDHGLVITDVSGDSGASAAGLRPGDVIIAVGGKEIGTSDELREAIATAGPGGKLTLSIVRGKDHLTVTATLSEHAA